MNCAQIAKQADFCDFASNTWDDEEYRFSSIKEDVAIALTSMLYHNGMSRTELCDRLGWKKSRVSKALSGKENLTLRTIYEIANAVGLRFDLVFNKVDEPRALQPWETKTFVNDLWRMHCVAKENVIKATAMVDQADCLLRKTYYVATRARNKAITENESKFHFRKSDEALAA